ncbi:MAG: ATP-binding protein [Bacteroidales bacterium]
MQHRAALINTQTKHITLISLITLCFYAGMNLLPISPKSHEVFNSIFSTGLTLFSGLSIFMLYRFARQHRLAIQKTLLWLTFSFVSWFIADCLWLWLIAIEEYPFPSLADLFYFGMYPSFIAAIVTIPSTQAHFKGVKRIIIEVSILILTAILFFLFLIKIPGQTFKEPNNFSLFITYLYPVLDIAIVWIILIRFFSNQLKSSKKVMLYFIGGIVGFTVSDLMYFIDSLYGINDPGYFIDLGYYTFYFVIVIAALIGTKEVNVRVHAENKLLPITQISKWLTFLPGVFLVSVVGFILIFVFDMLDVSNIAAIITLSLIYLLFIFHQYFVAKENFALNNEMNKINTELESKVIQRTNELNLINKELQAEIVYRKRTEEILLQSEERYRLIAENTSDVIWVMNAKTLEFTYVSPSVYNLTGFSVNEMINKSIIDFFTPQSLIIINKLKNRIDNYSINDTSNNISVDELQQICSNGNVIWVEMATTLIANSANVVTEIIGVTRNIEQRKKAENQIQQKNLQLEELNATKDKFFSIIAHDLKSPFGSIVSLSESLCFNIDNLPKDNIKSFVMTISYSAKLTFKLLENLLEWSKLQRENLKLNLRYSNFKSIVDEIILLNSEMSLNKNICVNNLIDANSFILCDIEVTKSILRNLISNALKFTNHNGLISINLEKFDSYAEIIITDTGVGIPSEKIPYLFNIEQDISTTGTNNEKGTGLGLILCKELAEKQGGKIWVQSQLGKGSSFHFTIPQQFISKQLFEQEKLGV